MVAALNIFLKYESRLVLTTDYDCQYLLESFEQVIDGESVKVFPPTPAELSDSDRATLKGLGWEYKTDYWEAWPTWPR